MVNDEIFQTQTKHKHFFKIISTQKEIYTSPIHLLIHNKHPHFENTKEHQYCFHPSNLFQPHCKEIFADFYIASAPSICQVRYLLVEPNTMVKRKRQIISDIFDT